MHCYWITKLIYNLPPNFVGSKDLRDGYTPTGSHSQIPKWPSWGTKRQKSQNWQFISILPNIRKPCSQQNLRRGSLFSTRFILYIATDLTKQPWKRKRKQSLGPNNISVEPIILMVEERKASSKLYLNLQDSCGEKIK